MYPSLTSIGSSSRWYTRKQTHQEVLLEIINLEERLEEKEESDVQVNISILINGKLITPVQMIQLREREKREGSEDQFGEEPVDQETGEVESDRYIANSDGTDNEEQEEYQRYNELEGSDYDNEAHIPLPSIYDHDYHYPGSPEQ